MDTLYQEILMDHYRNPRNKGPLTEANFTSGHYNPSCGDRVQLEGVIVDGRMRLLAFQGSGCVISLATASLLTQAVTTKTLSEIMNLDSTFIEELIGIRLGITRLKCALLPLIALQEGVQAYQQLHT